MRTSLIGGVLVAFAVGLSACGGAGGTAESEKALQRQADEYAISQIERDFHEAGTKKDIDQMMGLFSQNAAFTYGLGKTAVGANEIRKAWLSSALFEPETHVISDHPAYKLRVTINGNRGTLHFECHYIDVATEKVKFVTAGDVDVAKVDGRWLITKMVGGTAELRP